MVSYDSATHCLTFKKQFLIEGEATWTSGVSVNLQEFDESTRQFIIALAKQAINFANGHQMIMKHLTQSKTAKAAEEKAKSDTVKTEEVKPSTATTE